MVKEPTAIQRALAAIIASPEFAGAPVLQRFLTFIVEETLAGREHQLKSVVIAEAIFQRATQDDRSENAVRNSAVRLRAALNAYNARENDENAVRITVPKGRYVPEFAFAGDDPGRQAVARLASRKWLLGAFGIVIAGMLLVAGGLVYFRDAGPAKSVVVYVDVTDAVDDGSAALARMVQFRLAPQLSEIGLVTVVSPGAGRPGGNGRVLSFFLHSQADAGANKITWYLSNEQGAVVASGYAPLRRGGSEDVSVATSRVAFQILGETGALPQILERQYGSDFDGTVCKVRAQLLLRAEDMQYFDEITQCLRSYLDDHDSDAEAWASLGAHLAVHMRYYDASKRASYDSLLAEAQAATAHAELLAPNAYLTQVAVMQTALSGGEIWKFRAVSERVRREYPGDTQLHLRIASRLARLGQGQEAVAIYEAAQAEGAILNDLSADVGLAYFASGDLGSATGYVRRVVSDRLYELVLKAAILSRAGELDAARVAAEQLVETYPDIVDTLYSWLTGLGWAPDLVVDLGKALNDVGLNIEHL